MHHILLFTSSHTLAQYLFQILFPLLHHRLWIETCPFPDGPIAIFPKGVPSAFLMDTKDFPEQKDNPWFQLLSIQYSGIPALILDGSISLEELSISLACNDAFRPIKNPSAVSYLQSETFLKRLTSLSHMDSRAGLTLPDFSDISFVACLSRCTLSYSGIHMQEKPCQSPNSGDDASAPWGFTANASGNNSPLLDYCRILIEMFPSSFCYYNHSASILLFALHEPTANFTQLEQNRQFLMDRHGINPPDFSPFYFGIIHHDLSGLTSSFLEASEVYYMNRLQMPCSAFEEISSPPGQMLKPQKLMEIERSIRTDIQFREGENALLYTHQWFAECRKLHRKAEDTKYDLIILYASIKYTLFDMYGLKLKRIKSGIEVHEILRITDVDELENWFCTWLLYTLDNFDLTRSNTGFQLQEVLQFITNHIMDDLSLNVIASYFYVNPSYFSTLFKRETGQTYISYITRLKMDKAAELLAANCKVYETAHMLGYEDVRHFRNTFKKYHSISPSQVKAPAAE